MSASLLPNAELQFSDSNGSPLAGGKVYYYIPNTSTLKSTYQDSAQTILNTNPIILDAAGRAIVWGAGAYRQVVYDQFGNLVWDQITEDANSGLTGNMTDDIFVAGTDFTPGTTTQLTLTVNPGSIDNTWIYFDGVYQDDSQAALNANVLTFTSAIPVGVSKVTVKIGSTIAIGTPGVGTVTDSSISPGSSIYNRITQMVSVTDPAYGAKGDGVTDDTVAIQNCISANAYVFFPPGKTFKTTATISVPTTCFRIDGTGAFMTGPGISGTVDGFTFSGFYQGGGSIPVKSELYILPSLNGYRYGVYMPNSAFLRIFSDTIENVVAGYFCTVNSSSNYSVQNELGARNIWHCRNVANTLGAAFYLQMTGTASSSYQGNIYKANYADDCWAAVYQDNAGTSGTGGNINNTFEFPNIDQSDYAWYSTAVNSSGNFFKCTGGITSSIASVNFGQPFFNWDVEDVIELQGIVMNDPTVLAAANFELIGCTNRPAVTQFSSGSTPILYVSASGSDSTGTGSAAKPFATIQKALNAWTKWDLYGQTVFVYVADGTYSGGALYNSFGASGANGTIAIVGDPASPQNVVINAVGATAFSANGYGANVLLSGMTINGGVLAQSGGVLAIGPNVVFGTNTGGTHVEAQGFGSQININSNYTVTGGANLHYLALLGGSIVNVGASAIAFSGTIPFTVIAQANQGGQLSVPGITYTGAAVSGTRYSANLNGVIYTNGGGASYFPGTVVGSAGTGGQYA